jgi:glycosyltransferase involved in cell wall biosynthesis
LEKWIAYIDKYAVFPRELRRAAKQADVIHICDQGNGMYVPHLQDRPHIVTCHDVLAIRSALGEIPYWPTGRSGRAYQRAILSGLKKAQHLCCVSCETQSQAIRLTGLPPSRTSLILNGLFHPRERYGADKCAALLSGLDVDQSEPFLLHVGGNQPYKNRLGLIKIFAELMKIPSCVPRKLILAGKAPSPSIDDAIRELGIDESVCRVVGPSSDAITALYSSAWALLFPSLDEGFGMPIIEAQACGCPVFTTDRAPMTEVGGDAAAYLEIGDPRKAAEQIIEKSDDRASLVENGYAQRYRFDPDEMVSRYAEAYACAREEFAL